MIIANATKEMHDLITNIIGRENADKVIKKIVEDFVLVSNKDIKANDNPRGIQTLLEQNFRLVKHNAMLGTQLDDSLIELQRASMVLKRYKATIEGRLNDEN